MALFYNLKPNFNKIKKFVTRSTFLSIVDLSKKFFIMDQVI